MNFEIVSLNSDINFWVWFMINVNRTNRYKTEQDEKCFHDTG